MAGICVWSFRGSASAQLSREGFCWPQAIDKAISVVSMQTKPLRTEEAVKGLDLGAKSEAKLIELVTTGSLARNVAFLSDPQAQTLALVRPAR